MPASSQTAASERRNERTLTTHEPPKLKTTLKTPPKQATNPLQFVKVGPCSLYRTAQEQLQKVQEVKKIKQEVRDDPEDWQSNLDNWKSSRRKRQEHIIERVVEVKKLELEEHDRQRRRNKTFSEMMEERGNRGRKLSISLAMYNDEDANDLSDLGIGTSSGKSSVSGDTHDDTHSVLSDRDSEIEKSHSDVDNAADMTSSMVTSITALTTTTTTTTATIAATSATTITSATTMPTITATDTNTTIASTTTTTTTIATASTARKMFGGSSFHTNLNHNQEYDSGTTGTTSSPEPEEYTYEGAIRGYVSRVSQNIPRRSLTGIDSKLEAAKSSVNGSKTNLNDDSSKSPVSVVKVDILKRREVFEKASQKSNDGKTNNRLSGDFTGTKSIKERLSSLERQKYETENGEKATNKTLNRLSGDMSSIRERLTHLEKQASERESKSSVHRKLSTEDVETVRPLRERLSTLEKYSSSDESSVPTTTNESRSHNGELTARTIKDRLSALDVARGKDTTDKRGPAHVGKHPLCFRDQENRVDTSTPSERSSSPDSEYRVPRAVFHRSLDSLDADASSGPDTFERVQSLEELDYARQYPASSSSAELLNDTDREDSGIHTADVSCSVSQADEPIDEEIVQHAGGTIIERREPVVEERIKVTSVAQEDASTSGTTVEASNNDTAAATHSQFTSHREAVAVNKGTADISEELSTNKSQPQTRIETITNSNILRSHTSVPRAITTHPSPKVPSRETTLPESFSKLRAFSKDAVEFKTDSEPSLNESIVSASLKLCIEQPRPKFIGQAKRQNLSKEHLSNLPQPQPCSDTIIPSAETYQLSFPSVRATTIPTSLSLETSPVSKPASCRTISKIPTPLSRKTTKSSPTSSDTVLTSSVGKTSPSKAHSANNKPSTSQSPCPIRRTSETATVAELSSPVSPQASSAEVSPSSPSSRLPSASVRRHEDTLVPAERRRTVVEVCEKVVVPQGKAPTSPPVTPFITVNRVSAADKRTTPVAEERIVIEKADREEETATTVANRPAAPAVEHKQQETTETSASIGMPAVAAAATTTVTTNKCDVDTDVHDASNATVATPTADHPLERPTNLSLAKQEANLTDAVNNPSPTSPISKQILPLTLSNDEEIIAAQPFLLSPPTSVEPPKEKPPPPPVDVSDDENPPPEPLKRLNSTRRIKKELRTRRSDFLGIEGQVNDDDLEPELALTKPPDMAAILAEERRIEQLHRRSYDTDSNYEQDSSHERDSGVELGHVEDWAKQPVSPDMSQHSRQSSEPFGASVTSSEEDEITKKEREIIEVLEKEEQWRYGDNHEYNSDLGERLAHKLRELEEEKMQLEREAILRCNEDAFRKKDDSTRKQEDSSSHEQLQQQHDETAKQREIQARTTEEEAKYVGDKRKDEKLEMQSEQLKMQNEIKEKERRVVDACRKEEMRIRTMESQIREQENKALVGAGLSNNEDEFPSGEVLRVERELLQLEQEELKRQRNNLAYREQKQLRLAEQLQEQWKSLQDVAQNSIKNVQQYKYHTPAMNYRSSMPNLQFQDAPRRRPPPPPIPLSKPRMLDQRQRDVTIKNSRIPSADSIPQQVDASIRENAATTLGNHTGQQMSRQTLQALSAVPRPRIVQGDQWVQRRKSDVPRNAHDVNYQHWLIQEAEQRRINERNQRSPARKSQPHVTCTSVPYNAPIRTDSKPLPDSIIQTLTQRVQNKTQEKPLLTKRRPEQVHNQEHLTVQHQSPQYMVQSQKTQHVPIANNNGNQEKMLSVSGKKKCSHCGEELGRGAAMIIESLRLFYHMECFKCCVCHVRLGDGLMGTDVRVRNHKLHCHNCYSSDDGVKFSCV
ncbi:serine-rich adhesin for platelets [Monomorium pharaonis]|uniref:serine-rich adhesin for platelets n=1 Tax=Monomorium pharaonis TaxID=307658 RepID=UPI001746BD96|nr:serine-rich adhesin for platelets [Monomorium pharaonis]